MWNHRAPKKMSQNIPHKTWGAQGALHRHQKHWQSKKYSLNLSCCILEIMTTIVLIILVWFFYDYYCSYNYALGLYFPYYYSELNMTVDNKNLKRSARKARSGSFKISMWPVTTYLMMFRYHHAWRQRLVLNSLELHSIVWVRSVIKTTSSTSLHVNREFHKYSRQWRQTH